MTLSPPVRVVALVAALVLTGLAAVVLLLGRGVLGGEPATAPSPAATAARTTPHVTAHAGTKPGVRSAAPKSVTRPARARPPSGFPTRIDHALRYRRVVVVSVSIPGAAVDAIVRREARTAARSSRAGFVAVSALNERAVSSLVAKAGVIPEPAVLIVRRPGTIEATFSVTDAETISQAVAQARR